MTGSAAVVGLAWVVQNLAYGYEPTFDVGFALFVGAFLGVPLALVGGFLNVRRTLILGTQAKAFAAAAFVAGVLSYLHVLLAVLPTIVVYLGMVARISRCEQPDMGAPLCSKCGYNLTGLPLPRCPECGTRFSPSTGTPSSASVNVPEVDRS